MKFAGYKEHTEICCIYILQWTNREIKKTVVFTIASEKIKYLGISLAEEIPYTESPVRWKVWDTDENNWRHK